MTRFSHRSPKLKLATTPQLANALETQLRVRIYIPAEYQHEPVLSNLICKSGLVVNITSAMLGVNTEGGQFDLELRGATAQIHEGLRYLASLNIKIIGKPNTAGDSWHC